MTWLCSLHVSWYYPFSLPEWPLSNSNDRITLAIQTAAFIHVTSTKETSTNPFSPSFPAEISSPTRRSASIIKECIQGTGTTMTRVMMKKPRVRLMPGVKEGSRIAFMRSVCVGQPTALVSLLWLAMTIGQPFWLFSRCKVWCSDEEVDIFIFYKFLVSLHTIHVVRQQPTGAQSGRDEWEDRFLIKTKRKYIYQWWWHCQIYWTGRLLLLAAAAGWRRE